MKTTGFSRIMRSGYLAVLLAIGMLATVAPAHAQSADTWKSAAIIGGSTAAGAYIGHKIAGTTGAYIGAAAGAAAGYAIDQRRRQSEYNNDYYGDDGYYGNDSGYYGNSRPYENGGSNGGGYPYSGDYQNGSYQARGARRR